MAGKQSNQVTDLEESSEDDKQQINLSGLLLLGALLHNIGSSRPLARAKKIEKLSERFQRSDGNIAAIDFGTTSVSLAFTTQGDSEVTTLVLDEVKVDTRIPNSILLRRNVSNFYEVASFGRDACEKYVKMRLSEKKECVYFERIKLLLKRDQVRFHYT